MADLGCYENLRICIHGLHQCRRSSFFVSFEFLDHSIHFSILSDSESQISQMAFQALIELAEVWPNAWISKEVFHECIYSILSQV